MCPIEYGAPATNSSRGDEQTKLNWSGPEGRGYPLPSQDQTQRPTSEGSVLLPLVCKIPATASPQEWRTPSKFTKVSSMLLYVSRTAEEAYLILEPAHALMTQLLLEGVSTKLGGQQRNVLYDGQPHPPVGVICQIFNGWHQALPKQVDAYHLIHLHKVLPFQYLLNYSPVSTQDSKIVSTQDPTVKVTAERCTHADLIELANNVQPDVWHVVLQEAEKHREQVLYSSSLSQRWCHFHDNCSQRAPDMLAAVGCQGFDAGEHQLSDLHS